MSSPSPASFTQTLEAYAALEREIRTVQGGMFSDVCALCTSCCCTPNICEESLDSAFLRSVRSVHPPRISFCERFGWLTERGCGLEAGRPPICDEFFCDDITTSLPERERGLVRVLGRLLTWVGAKGAGRCHVVEVMDDDALAESINCDRLLERIGIAHQAFEGVRNALGGGDVSHDQRLAIQRIDRSAQFDA